MKAKMNPFDPWTATWTEAERLGGDGSTGGYDRWQHNPVFQKRAADRVTGREEAVKAGDGCALLACVRDCLEYGLVAPEWLVERYVVCHDQVAELRAKSWDDAFGKPFPKGRRIDRMLEDRNNLGPVYLAVKARIEAGEPTGDALFEDVAREKGLCATKVRELYYKGKKAVDAFNKLFFGLFEK